MFRKPSLIIRNSIIVIRNSLFDIRNKQTGEIATALTLLSVGLMLLGIIAGNVAVKKSTESRSNAQMTLTCHTCSARPCTDVSAVPGTTCQIQGYEWGSCSENPCGDFTVGGCSTEWYCNNECAPQDVRDSFTGVWCDPADRWRWEKAGNGTDCGGKASLPVGQCAEPTSANPNGNIINSEVQNLNIKVIKDAPKVKGTLSEIIRFYDDNSNEQEFRKETLGSGCDGTYITSPMIKNYMLKQDVHYGYLTVSLKYDGVNGIGDNEIMGIPDHLDMPVKDKTITYQSVDDLQIPVDQICPKSTSVPGNGTTAPLIPPTTPTSVTGAATTGQPTTGPTSSAPDVCNCGKCSDFFSDTKNPENQLCQGKDNKFFAGTNCYGQDYSNKETGIKNYCGTSGALKSGIAPPAPGETPAKLCALGEYVTDSTGNVCKCEKIDAAGLCNFACCGDNSHCPDKEECGIPNGYCPYGTRSCAPVAPKQSVPLYVRMCQGANACAWTFCDGRNTDIDKNCIPKTQVDALISDGRTSVTKNDKGILCLTHEECNNWKPTPDPQVNQCIHLGTAKKENLQKVNCPGSQSFCVGEGKAVTKHWDCTQSNESGCFYWCESKSGGRTGCGPADGPDAKTFDDPGCKNMSISPASSGTNGSCARCIWDNANVTGGSNDNYKSILQQDYCNNKTGGKPWIKNDCTEAVVTKMPNRPVNPIVSNEEVTAIINEWKKGSDAKKTYDDLKVSTCKTACTQPTAGPTSAAPRQPQSQTPGGDPHCKIPSLSAIPIIGGNENDAITDCKNDPKCDSSNCANTYKDQTDAFGQKWDRVCSPCIAKSSTPPKDTNTTKPIDTSDCETLSCNDVTGKTVNEVGHSKSTNKYYINLPACLSKLPALTQTTRETACKPLSASLPSVLGPNINIDIQLKLNNYCFWPFGICKEQYNQFMILILKDPNSKIQLDYDRWMTTGNIAFPGGGVWSKYKYEVTTGKEYTGIFQIIYTYNNASCIHNSEEIKFTPSVTTEKWWYEMSVDPTNDCINPMLEPKFSTYSNAEYMTVINKYIKRQISARDMSKYVAGRTRVTSLQHQELNFCDPTSAEKCQPGYQISI